MNRAAVVLLIGILSSGCSSSTERSEDQAQSGTPEVTITSPTSGAVVPQRSVVTGASANIGANQILVFVFAPGANRWFFQDPATISSDGTWQVNVFVGGPDDRGSEFRIQAIVMAQVPTGLSELAADSFPPAGTLHRSEAISVRRE